MLEVVFFRVREDRVDDLRDWMEELRGREDEVLETFRNEGTRHERAFVLEGRDGPVLAYVMEMDDPEVRVCQQPYRSSLPNVRLVTRIPTAYSWQQYWGRFRSRSPKSGGR